MTAPPGFYDASVFIKGSHLFRGFISKRAEFTRSSQMALAQLLLQRAT